MNCLLHHAALNVTRYDWYVSFFQDVFGMTVKKTSGEAPCRKVWFYEGIQLNETSGESASNGFCDHLGIQTNDQSTVLQKAYQLGCSPHPNGPHWFQLPDGFPIELMN